MIFQLVIAVFFCVLCVAYCTVVIRALFFTKSPRQKWDEEQEMIQGWLEESALRPWGRR